MKGLSSISTVSNAPTGPMKAASTVDPVQLAQQHLNIGKMELAARKLNEVAAKESTVSFVGKGTRLSVVDRKTGEAVMNINGIMERGRMVVESVIGPDSKGGGNVSVSGKDAQKMMPDMAETLKRMGDESAAGWNNPREMAGSKLEVARNQANTGPAETAGRINPVARLTQ